MGKTVYDLLVGKMVRVMTDMKVEVELEIESVEQIAKNNVITPDTRENGFWGESYYSYTYKVTFTNGSTKTYSDIGGIVVED